LVGEKLGFEKLSLKNDKLRAFFISNNEKYFNSDEFGGILSFVQKHPRKCKMKDVGGKAVLVTDGIKTVDGAIDLLQQMQGQAASKSANEILSR
jgi:transcription-repair coupling factor (superfamily II helicase)